MDSGDCSGQTCSLFSHMTRSYNDAAYLALYNSLTRDQRAEIGYDQMDLLGKEAEIRLQPMQVCSEQEGCPPPCADEGYSACQLGRGAMALAPVAKGQGVGIGSTALIGRACAADAAAAGAESAVGFADDAVASAYQGVVPDVVQMAQWGLP